MLDRFSEIRSIPREGTPTQEVKMASPPPVVFRLTFNLPAERQFFDDEDEGIRIKIDDGQVYFRAVAEVKDDDAVPVSQRQRGGREVTVDGASAGMLLKLLEEKGATTARPFFTAYKANREGWFGIEHYDADGAPPKFTPHVRTWAPRDASEEQPLKHVDDEISSTLGDFAALIRTSHNILTDHLSDRRIGRPPKEVSEAEAVLKAFGILAYEVLPNLNPQEYLRPLQDASTAISRLTQMINHRMSEIAAYKSARIAADQPNDDDEQDDEQDEEQDEDPAEEAPRHSAVPHDVMNLTVSPQPYEGKRRGRPPSARPISPPISDEPVVPKRRGRPPKNAAMTPIPTPAPVRPKVYSFLDEVDPAILAAAAAAATKSSQPGPAKASAPPPVHVEPPQPPIQTPIPQPSAKEIIPFPEDEPDDQTEDPFAADQRLIIPDDDAMVDVAEPVKNLSDEPDYVEHSPGSENDEDDDTTIDTQRIGVRKPPRRGWKGHARTTGFFRKRA